MIRTIGAFLAAVIGTYLLGVVFISQANLANIAEMGLTVGFSVRIDTLLHDLTHMTEIYLPLVTVSSIIAFPVATGIIRLTPGLRLIGYISAGFVALIAMHLIMKMVLGLTGVAPTRTMMGLLAQGIAGAFGGYLFHVLTLKKAS
ncbi:MAG: hypothetical protein JKY88_15415 [Pseudomonadales bacterium]|nr:hypothetical protein [Pseudomonadales bacterium]